MSSRQKVNEIVSGKLYQRGNMLSWPRETKNKIYKDRNIGVVVNLWTRLDPDLTDAPIDWHLYIPIPPSDTLTQKVMIGAIAVADYLAAHPDKSALILCEAGMTRSVFFAGIVACMITDLPGSEVYPELANCVTNLDLTPAMKEALLNFKP